MHDTEQRVEVVLWLIDVEHRNCAVRANALSKVADCRAHRDERILALRRTVISQNDRMGAEMQTDAFDRLFKERKGERGASSLKLGVFVVLSIAFHHAVRACGLIRHRMILLFCEKSKKGKHSDAGTSPHGTVIVVPVPNGP